MFTADKARELFDYDPDTGIVKYKISRRSFGGRAVAGSVAGWVDNYGYRCIGVLGKNYKAHRIAWLLMTGKWPSGEIDHINSNSIDNRWTNLRLATHGQNCVNKEVKNKIGLRGVSAHGVGFRGTVQLHGEKHRTKTFNTPQEAHVAYYELAQKLQGKFARAT